MSEPAPQKIEYTLNDGVYSFHIDGKKVFDTEEVAILFDKNLVIVHKHGQPETVEKSKKEYRARFEAAGLTEMANNLEIIKGKLPLKDLNGVIHACGDVLALYAKVRAAEARGTAAPRTRASRTRNEAVAEPA